MTISDRIHSPAKSNFSRVTFNASPMAPNTNQNNAGGKSIIKKLKAIAADDEPFRLGTNFLK
jgi:hypothetical protein